MVDRWRKVSFIKIKDFVLNKNEIIGVEYFKGVKNEEFILICFKNSSNLGSIFYDEKRNYIKIPGITIDDFLKALKEGI